jgi:hypothetical protein
MELPRAATLRVQTAISVGNEESQLDATITTCFGQQFCPSSGALDYAIRLGVCCTQYVAGRWSGNGVTRSPTGTVLKMGKIVARNMSR